MFEEQCAVLAHVLLQDPYHYKKYLAHNQFLADINNERTHKQQQYMENMLSLKQLVLVRFSNDILVVPRDSAWFGYWDGHRLQSMNETQLYQVLACLPLATNISGAANTRCHKPEQHRNVSCRQRELLHSSGGNPFNFQHCSGRVKAGKGVHLQRACLPA